MVVGMSPSRRRTDRILEAIQQELNVRRAQLNADATIRSINIIVKMVQGTDQPRAIILTVETERTLKTD